jgi:hypothetical protein
MSVIDISFKKEDLLRNFLCICIVGFVFCIDIQGFSQPSNPALSLPITLQTDTITLKEVIQKISSSSGIQFSYNPAVVPVDSLIKIDEKDISLKDLLDAISDRFGLDYEVVEKQIIIKKAGQVGPGSIKEEESVTLKGFIQDTESGENLIGATIFLPDLKTGTISNAYGFYSITLPSGDYSLSISYIGYDEIAKNLTLRNDQTIDFHLDPSETVMEEIIVLPDQQISFINTSQMSNLDISPRDLKQIPAFFGEGDVIKSLQSIPGIQLFGDGSTLFFVRGGDRDQNMILLDEAPIYNPSHLLGLFSTFIPEGVKDITIYKGDIPARYGGRLSSLIDIRTNDGNLNKFSMVGTLGMLSTKLGIESPIVREKASFFISSRISQIGWFFKNLSDQVKDFYFYDINSKFNWKINNNNRVFLTFYSGADMYSERSNPNSSSGINWGNNSLTFRWNHIFSKKLFSNTTLYASSYHYNLYTSIEQENFWNSEIDNLTLKSDFSFFPNTSMTLFAGIGFSGHNINPGNFYVNNQLNINVPYVSKKHNREWAFYAENDHEINKKLKVRYGLRLSIWENTGEAIEIDYDDNLNPVDSSYYSAGKVYDRFINLEPRLSLNYQVNNSLSLKASYSRNTQYMHLITNSISPFTSLDVWLPSGPNIPDQDAHQVAFGLIQGFSKSGIVIRGEVYYKKMNNQIDYIDHAQMLLNPFIEAELRYGDAWAYGMEISAEKKAGRLRGWMGYSLSKAWRKFSQINQGNKYPAFYDRPHEISITTIYDFNPRINASINWYYASGAAISTPSGFYYYRGHTLPIYGEKNNDRLPDYHRMDVSVQFRLNKKPAKFKHFIGLSIFNLYGRKNPVFLNFNKTEVDTNEFRIPGDLGSIPNLLSTQTYIYNVIPSINYHFRFN